MNTAESTTMPTIRSDPVSASRVSSTGPGPTSPMMPPTARLLNTLLPRRLPTSSSVSPWRARLHAGGQFGGRGAEGDEGEADEAARQVEGGGDALGPVDDEP